MRRLNSAGRLAVAGWMLTLWLAVVVISVSPALHQLLHHDFQSDQHECLITHFAKGCFPSEASVGVALMAYLVWVVAPLPVDLKFVSSLEYCLSYSRAPPAVLSSPRVLKARAGFGLRPFLFAFSLS